MTIKTIDVQPTTEIIHSMRRAGYKWYEAILDIVDNSVDALRVQYSQTKNTDGFVKISHSTAKEAVKSLIVADNGTGIDRSTLENIMRMGWSAKRGGDHLGTFGMGLKTAGISLGDIITVVSSTSDASKLNMVKWDVETILQTQKFNAEFRSGSSVPSDMRGLYLNHVGDRSGTMVIIGKLLEIVPTSAGAITKTLVSKCKLNYRHVLDPKNISGYHFPFNIKVRGKKGYLEHDFDPLLWDSEGTSALIGSKSKSVGHSWGNFDFEVRLVHHRPENCVARRDDGTLGAGIRSRSGLYFVRGGRTISSGHYDLLKYSSSVSNVYGEVFFKDTGTSNSSSPIQMDFGKKGVILDSEFETWIRKHVFRPYVKKIAEEQKKEAKNAKKKDRSKYLDHVSTLNFPSDLVGRDKNNAGTKAAKIFSPVASNKSGKNTKKRKYRGTSVNVGNQETSIRVEEVAWRGSELPFIANMEAGDPEITLQLNVKHPWVEENIYMSSSPERVAIAIQLATATALSVLHEEDHVQDEILKKQGNLLSLLGDHYGSLSSEEIVFNEETEEENFIIEEEPFMGLDSALAV